MLHDTPKNPPKMLGTPARGTWGAGPEWIAPLGRDIVDYIKELGCIEIIPENFFDNSEHRDFLRIIAENNVPTLIHAVGLSLATDAPFKTGHLHKVLEVAAETNAIGLSDHLSMTEAGDIEIGQLTPVPWTIEQADIVIRKIEMIQRMTDLPFSFEHVAYRFFYPRTELSETAFINRILDRTGCNLILDLQNLHCNAKNGNYDPLQWLEEINLDAATSIHLAGGFISADGTYQDGHNNPVSEPVWDLFAHVLTKIMPQAVVIERTGNYPGIQPVLAEIRRAQSMLTDACEKRRRGFSHKATCVQSYGVMS